MGVGKTTIGKLLAAHTGKAFIDSDAVIVEKTGAGIELIFEIEGEAGFRKRESQIIDELTRQQNIILATGGGAVLVEDNRKCLSSRGFVIYLQASAEQLMRRTVRDSKRPLLQTEDRLGRIRDLLQQREPVYEKLADLIINTDNQNAKQVVSRICRKLKTI
jgi:shikimate kinase